MSDEDRPNTPLTPVVFHVLLSLADGALHGYGIMKRVEADSGIRMGPGTVYGSLNRLIESGWVDEVAATEAPGEDPRRGRAFVLTKAGRTALRLEAARITRLSRLRAVRKLAPERGGAR
jgi:DNA-binding PadR family transcriptional regulator